MLNRPRIQNLRWFPENQTEPDDETSFDFEIFNDADNPVKVWYLRFNLAGGSKPVPGSVTSLVKNFPNLPNDIAFYMGATLKKGGTIELAPKASMKLYGVLTTKNAPGAAYPIKFTMQIMFDWEFTQPFEVAASGGAKNTIVDD